MQTEIASTTVVESDALHSTGNYADLLESFGLAYKKAEYYWQVGELSKTQGWILHVSVVLSQIRDLLQLIVPFLANEGVSFKIAMDETVGEDLLIGNLGFAQIGKIVSIYPDNNSGALELAKKLIPLTNSYKGPAIPTDICLGNIIHTRYGSFNPIIKTDSTGNDEKYIYDHRGELVRDPYSMPFKLPQGIEWPYAGLADPILPDPPKYFNRLYKIIDVLKADPRGNVYKGLYVKSLFQVKNCVLKQGFSNSGSDTAGRDIQDRLIWQANLYKKLSATVPMPTIYDLIHENGFTLLVMEYINGVSLYEKAEDINPLSKTWSDLFAEDLLALIRYSIEVTLIIAEMHQRGYVHRDINPVNFLINKNDKILLIDIELAYSLHDHRPYPPFTLGTPGFMSPEQQDIKEPTIEQDIYSFGATLIHLFTGLTPIRFNSKNAKSLYINIEFFIRDKEISTTIAGCLHPDPKFRPNIATISKALIKYQERVQHGLKASYPPSSTQRQDDTWLQGTILAALNGLVKPPVMSVNDLWYSKRITIENHTSSKNKQYAKYPGLSEGMSGPLYLLARLHNAGINIDSCRERFTKGWQFIEQNHFTNLSSQSPGLFRGSAGIALAFAAGMHSGLLEKNVSNREVIQNCLDIPNDKLDLAAGIAGQGLAILQCRTLLNVEVNMNSVDNMIDHLLYMQRNDGSWIDTSHKKNKIKAPDLSCDDTGIIWFLLEYHAQFPKTEVQNAIAKGLSRIQKNKDYMHYFNGLVASKASYEKGDGGKGTILIFLKAYEIFKIGDYRRIAENALFKYPPRIVHPNFTQQNGIAGLGELYLEAWRVLKNEEWKNRAHWIACVYQHTLFSTADDTGYWILEENNPPTADLLTGNSGIIHFLARCLHSDKIGYRLLN